MNKNCLMKIKKIVIAILVILLINIIFSNYLFAFKPGDIQPRDITVPGEIDATLTKTENEVRVVGAIIAVGTLMVIGIKYMMGSIEERANYKGSLLPWVIGAILLFGATIIYEPMKEVLVNATSRVEAEIDLGNIILGWIQIFGTYIAVAGLMIIGIKYIVGSVDERAQYRKSMLPWVVGLIILASAVNITKFIANNLSAESGSASETTATTSE